MNHSKIVKEAWIIIHLLTYPSDWIIPSNSKECHYTTCYLYQLRKSCLFTSSKEAHSLAQEACQGPIWQIDCQRVQGQLQECFGRELVVATFEQLYL